MAGLHSIVHVFVGFVCHVATSTSVKPAVHSAGFVYSKYLDTNMISLTCTATHLPSDAKYLYTVDLEHKKLGTEGTSLVIASLKSHGE